VRSAHLIIVCGVPGAGKSSFALHAVKRWDAICFASETFAETLGPVARGPSGDLTPEAIMYAYPAMGAAVENALSRDGLVVAVGSFRSEEQRSRFRVIAKSYNASVTTLRVVCPVEIAAKRIHARLALGERGPDEKAIRKIADGLNGADDIDLVLSNDSSIDDFYRRIDAVVEPLILAATPKTSDRKP
jgi:predicted kinase